MENNYTVDLKAVGMRIRKARVALKLTQVMAAGRANLNAQYWSMLEIGKERGSVQTYLQIALALDVRLDDLFYDDTTLSRAARSLARDEILTGCTMSEQKIITEMILALKTALIRARQE